MAEKTLSPEIIKEAIVKKALILKRKKELHESVQSIESELKSLNESYAGLTGTFGFAHAGDVSNKTKTGFVGTPNISHIQQLESEMAESVTSDKPALSEEVMLELNKLKEEIETLKKENASLKESTKK